MAWNKAVSWVVTALLMLVSASAFAGDVNLVGTWRLVGFTRTVLATGETTDVFGKSPHGYLQYAPDGHMMVLLVGSTRPKPAEPSKMTEKEQADLYKSTIAYAGTYSFDGKIVTHHIETSWNELWSGTDQKREIKLEGDRLTVSTIPAPSPLDGKVDTAALTFERVK